MERIVAGMTRQNSLLAGSPPRNEVTQMSYARMSRALPLALGFVLAVTAAATADS